MKTKFDLCLVYNLIENGEVQGVRYADHQLWVDEEDFLSHYPTWGDPQISPQSVKIVDEFAEEHKDDLPGHCFDDWYVEAINNVGSDTNI